MSALTDYAEGQIIAHIFRTASFAKPSALYVGLLTAAASDGAVGTEVTGGSYARVACNPSDSNWAAPSAGNGTTSNAVAITFPAPTANWGTIVGFGIYDASTAGNMLIYGSLTQSKTVNNGDAAPSFAIGALTFQIDN